MRRLIVILSATIMLAFSGCAIPTSSDVNVNKLRCEYRVNPLGIDVVKPRLSWIMESIQRGQIQSAYQVLVAGSEKKLERNKGDIWNSGKVESDQSIQVVYKGKELKSR
ncbi:MAG: glycoside hydrolase family 78 protein, partial [Planctomycetota bacterium]